MNNPSFPLGDWFLTSSGKQFWPLDPKAEHIDISDIAHALSHICRYGGHCTIFYSVAQHSVHVSRLCDECDAREGLLHDAPEAYIGDMVRPLKYSIPQYREIEAKIWHVVAAKFNIREGTEPDFKPPSVQLADDRALMTERRDLVVKSPIPWRVTVTPDEERIVPLRPEQARGEFLERFKELFPFWGRAL